MKTKSVDKFYDLTDAEDYFNFFEIEYDQKLVNVKRFHILKEYGAMIRKGSDNLKGDENRLLDFLKFSLLKVYKDYEGGHAPSAADVWSMFKDGKLSGCLSCTPEPGNSCGC